MRVTADDIVTLTHFPLLWRWTQETRATLTPDKLASIRPIRSAKAATICAGLLSRAVEQTGAKDRIDVNGDTAAPEVKNWLEERTPGEESEVLLLWDCETAALLPRRLFIDRWDDFWYASSDDLAVMGIVEPWRIEMYHHGMFDFSAGGAGEQGVRRPSMWPTNWVSSEPEIHALLAQWQGGMAEPWAYSVSHGQFLLRLHRHSPRSLFVWCKACYHVSFQSHWQSSAVRLVVATQPRFLLSDRERLSVSCQAVFAAETETFDVQLSAGA